MIGSRGEKRKHLKTVRALHAREGSILSICVQLRYTDQPCTWQANAVTKQANKRRLRRNSAFRQLCSVDNWCCLAVDSAWMHTQTKGCPLRVRHCLPLQRARQRCSCTRDSYIFPGVSSVNGWRTFRCTRVCRRQGKSACCSRCVISSIPHPNDHGSSSSSRATHLLLNSRCPGGLLCFGECRERCCFASRPGRIGPRYCDVNLNSALK